MGQLSKDLRGITLLAQVLLLALVGLVVTGLISLIVTLFNLFSFILNVMGQYHG